MKARKGRINQRPHLLEPLPGALIIATAKPFTQNHPGSPSALSARIPEGLLHSPASILHNSSPYLPSGPPILSVSPFLS